MAHIPAGLLVAACVNRAAEGTFGAAIAEVGVLDYLKVIIALKYRSPLLTLSLHPVPQVHHRSVLLIRAIGHCHQDC